MAITKLAELQDRHPKHSPHAGKPRTKERLDRGDPDRATRVAVRSRVPYEAAAGDTCSDASPIGQDRKRAITTGRLAASSQVPSEYRSDENVPYLDQTKSYDWPVSQRN